MAVDSKEPDVKCNENNGACSSSSKVGAFELHIMGLGSKIMAKMWYVEGPGLSKDDQGVADPIKALQRPK